MNHSYSLTVLAAAAFVLFTNGAQSSPHLQTLGYSPLPLEAGLRCGLVDGQLVCGNKSSGKHQDDDDDDDHNKGKKKKTKDDASGLTECTIQGGNSGGGCKGGFKYVCEKMKSGKKCCGCVVDKNAKSAEQPQKSTWRCTDATGLSAPSDAENAAEARASFDRFLTANQLTAKDPVVCGQSKE
jgi:hypothetical protein